MPYQIMHKGKWNSPDWKAGDQSDSKVELEREAFRMVHIAETHLAIVVEMQPVAVTRIERKDGIVQMTHPNAIVDDRYR
jgi:hypothetical protein